MIPFTFTPMSGIPFERTASPRASQTSLGRSMSSTRGPRRMDVRLVSATASLDALHKPAARMTLKPVLAVNQAVLSYGDQLRADYLSAASLERHRASTVTLRGLSTLRRKPDTVPTAPKTQRQETRPAQHARVLRSQKSSAGETNSQDREPDMNVAGSDASAQRRVARKQPQRMAGGARQSKSTSPQDEASTTVLRTDPSVPAPETIGSDTDNAAAEEEAAADIAAMRGWFWPGLSAEDDDERDGDGDDCASIPSEAVVRTSASRAVSVLDVEESEAAKLQRKIDKLEEELKRFQRALVKHVSARNKAETALEHAQHALKSEKRARELEAVEKTSLPVKTALQAEVNDLKVKLTNARTEVAALSSAREHAEIKWACSHWARRAHALEADELRAANAKLRVALDDEARERRAAQERADAAMVRASEAEAKAAREHAAFAEAAAAASKAHDEAEAARAAAAQAAAEVSAAETMAANANLRREASVAMRSSTKPSATSPGRHATMQPTREVPARGRSHSRASLASVDAADLHDVDEATIMAEVGGAEDNTPRSDEVRAPEPAAGHAPAPMLARAAAGKAGPQKKAGQRRARRRSRRPSLTKGLSVGGPSAAASSPALVAPRKRRPSMENLAAAMESLADGPSASERKTAETGAPAKPEAGATVAVKQLVSALEAEREERRAVQAELARQSQALAELQAREKHLSQTETRLVSELKRQQSDAAGDDIDRRVTDLLATPPAPTSSHTKASTSVVEASDGPGSSAAELRVQLERLRSDADSRISAAEMRCAIQEQLASSARKLAAAFVRKTWRLAAQCAGQAVRRKQDVQSSLALLRGIGSLERAAGGSTVDKLEAKLHDTEMQVAARERELSDLRDQLSSVGELRSTLAQVQGELLAAEDTARAKTLAASVLAWRLSASRMTAAATKQKLNDLARGFGAKWRDGEIERAKLKREYESRIAALEAQVEFSGVAKAYNAVPTLTSAERDVLETEVTAMANSLSKTEAELSKVRERHRSDRRMLAEADAWCRLYSAHVVDLEGQDTLKNRVESEMSARGAAFNIHEFAKEVAGAAVAQERGAGSGSGDTRGTHGTPGSGRRDRRVFRRLSVNPPT